MKMCVFHGPEAFLAERNLALAAKLVRSMWAAAMKSILRATEHQEWLLLAVVEDVCPLPFPVLFMLCGLLEDMMSITIAFAILMTKG